MNTKTLFSPIAILFVSVVLLTACKDEETPVTTPPQPDYTATVNGQQEKPTSTTSAATGTFAANLNQTTRVMSYTVTFQGITPTMGHIHKVEKADGTGGVIIPFTGTLTSPYSNTALLAQSRIDSLNNGLLYVNLHTTAYPAGEIRGDIKRR